MDSKRLKEDIEDDSDALSDEDIITIEALQLYREHQLEMAREKAEDILEVNPANSIATFVTGLECENRQDWSEAARFYLMGLGQNPDDHGMELGFQTNLDMLRAVRHRWIKDQVTDKWEDVLSFKPKEIKTPIHNHVYKPPWWRLGPLYEALIQDPEEAESTEKQAYLQDLLADVPNPSEQRMELRRVLYQNMDYLDIVYEYYRLEMTEDWPADRRIDGQVKDTTFLDAGPKQSLFDKDAASNHLQILLQISESMRPFARWIMTAMMGTRTSSPSAVPPRRSPCPSEPSFASSRTAASFTGTRARECWPPQSTASTFRAVAAWRA